MRTPFRAILPLLLVAACEGAAPPPITPPAPSSSAVVVAPPATSASETPVMTVAPAALDLDPVAVALTAPGITNLCDGSIVTAKKLLDDVRALEKAPDAALTWDATFGKLDDVALALTQASSFPELMAVAHPDKAVREAAKGCEPKVSELSTAIYLDSALATVFRRYAAKKETLDGPRQRLVDHTIRDYKRNGLDLDAKGQIRLRELNDELTKIGQSFESNIADSTLAITVTAKDLEGLPPPYVDSHKPDASGNVKITTDYPDAFPFFQYAKNRAAALELYKLFDNRAADKNVALLDKLLGLRAEKAKLLGYATWADYVLEPRMAKDPKTVASFLDGLRKHLAKKGAEELAEFKQEHAKLGGKATDAIMPSDRAYLEDQLRVSKYGLDSKEVSEYFEVSSVKQGLLDITAKMYGITYRPAKTLPTWHADVEAIEILDASGKVIGRFYFDLFPREGKYKHAAVFGIRSSKTMATGDRQMPIAAIVCNFPRPGGDTPALMSHQDAQTFFHEFGHVLHQLLTTASLASFSGTQVARDFVEAPSQMFEEWVWSKDTLSLFAKHYKTGKPLPDKLFAAMKKSRGFGRAMQTQRQLFLAALDQTYHTRAPGFDSTAVLKEVYAAYMPYAFVEGTHFQATFGHLVGYDAGYYGYQWALNIARDLFTRFEKEGMLNAKTASDYRHAILEPGGSDEEAHLIEKFLGRKASDEAYKRYLDEK